MDRHHESEEYAFLTLYSRDLGEAMRAATLVRRRLTRELRGIIFRHLVVAYTRPFSGNRGTTKRRHRLQEGYVPVGGRALHDRLVLLRNCYFAHTDQAAYSPELLPFPQARGRRSLMVMLSYPPEEQLLRSLPEIVHLIGAVMEGVEAERKRIEKLLVA